MKRFLVVLLAALAIALPATAQEQRGSIQGVVKDSQAGALVGAVVVAKSATGVSVEAVTDATGAYRFPALQTGKYEVTATMSGFGPAKVQNIDLRLGQTLSVPLTLSPGAMSETVQVVGESPLIAITQSARATSIKGEAIDKMPKGRDFSSLVAQAPGANVENEKFNGISIDGASSSENRFIIDGAESTNLQSGISGKRLITDFVDEVQVKSSGYTAEYGGATGGVISVITKSGSNTFRGDVGGYWSSDVLNGDNRPTLRLKPTDSNQAEYITYDKDSFNRVEPGFTLSGPISKDKAWFFIGYQPSFRPLDRTTKYSDGSPVTQTQKVTNQDMSANITSQMSSKLRSRLAFNMSNQKQEGTLPALDGSTAPGTVFATNEVFPNYSGSLNFDYTPSNSMFMSLRAGYYRSNHYSEGISDDTWYLFRTSNVGQAGVPPAYQQVTNYSNIPTNSSTTRDIQERLSAQFDTTFFFQGKGQHQLKLGISFDRLGNNILSGEQNNLVRIYWNRAYGGQRGAYGYYRVRSNGVLPDQGYVVQGDISSNNFGLFAQDSWTISNRFTLNLGLRTENENVPAYTTGTDVLENPIKFSFSDKIAPRVGFAWDVQGDGKTKVYGSWGIFYDIMKLELPQGSWGGQKWWEYYYTLDTYEYDKLDVAGCPPACPGQKLDGPIDFRHPSAFEGDGGVDPNLEPMKMQEMVLGVDRELLPTLSIGARYVHKQIDRAIEDVGKLDADGNEVYTIANPGYGLRASFVPEGGTVAIPYPAAKRDYDAVELSLNKRMANNWSARFSYLWSKLEGNYSGLSQSDENGRNSPNVGRLFDHPLMAFDQTGSPAYGPLPTDRTHQLKLQAVYDFKFGLTAGLNWWGATGIPRTREAAWNPASGYTLQYAGRNSDGRLPFLNQADLYLQQELRLSGAKRLVFSANIANLLNSETETNYFQTELASGQVVDVPETTILYQGANFPALIKEQAIPLDPRFMKANAYQTSRAIRLGVKFLF